MCITVYIVGLSSAGPCFQSRFPVFPPFRPASIGFGRFERRLLRSEERGQRFVFLDGARIRGQQRQRQCRRCGRHRHTAGRGQRQRQRQERQEAYHPSKDSSLEPSCRHGASVTSGYHSALRTGTVPSGFYRTFLSPLTRCRRTRCASY